MKLALAGKRALIMGEEPDSAMPLPGPCSKTARRSSSPGGEEKGSRKPARLSHNRGRTRREVAHLLAMRGWYAGVSVRRRPEIPGLTHSRSLIVDPSGLLGLIAAVGSACGPPSSGSSCLSAT